MLLMVRTKRFQEGVREIHDLVLRPESLTLNCPVFRVDYDCFAH